MAGTSSGAKKARDANLAKDPNYYSKMGSKGGSTITKEPKGFAANPELAREAGEKGKRTRYKK